MKSPVIKTGNISLSTLKTLVLSASLVLLLLLTDMLAATASSAWTLVAVLGWKLPNVNWLLQG
jgi:hypothetical protein